MDEVGANDENPNIRGFIHLLPTCVYKPLVMPIDDANDMIQVWMFNHPNFIAVRIVFYYSAVITRSDMIW